MCTLREDRKHIDIAIARGAEFHDGLSSLRLMPKSMRNGENRTKYPTQTLSAVQVTAILEVLRGICHAVNIRRCDSAHVAK